MGEFSELVLSFNFRDDTPDEVLAAFSSLERTLPQTGHLAPAPTLPTPVVEPSEYWRPEFLSQWVDEGVEDEFASEPWRHDWATWLSRAMGAETVPSAALTWTNGKQWNFACRSSFKTAPEVIAEFLAWLGPFIQSWQGEALLLGYVQWEAPRPYLLWCTDGRVTMEDLNPDDSWQFGGWVPPEE